MLDIMCKVAVKTINKTADAERGFVKVMITAATCSGKSH